MYAVSHVEDGDSLRLRPTWFFGELGCERLKILQVHLQQGTISPEECQHHLRDMGLDGE